MGTYVEQNLNRNETLIRKATLSKIPLIIKGIFAGIFLILLIAGIIWANSIESIEDWLQEEAEKRAEATVSENYDEDSDEDDEELTPEEELEKLYKEAFGEMVEKKVSYEDYASLMILAFIYVLFTKALWFVVLICAIPVGRFVRGILTYLTTELALTDKRMIGKTGIIKTESMDASLDKIQTVSVSSGLFGKIFGYGNVKISLASLESFRYQFVLDADEYKRLIMQRIDDYEKSKNEQQAKQMADMVQQMKNS